MDLKNKWKTLGVSTRKRILYGAILFGTTGIIGTGIWMIFGGEEEVPDNYADLNERQKSPEIQQDLIDIPEQASEIYENTNPIMEYSGNDNEKDIPKGIKDNEQGQVQPPEVTKTPPQAGNATPDKTTPDKTTPDKTTPEKLTPGSTGTDKTVGGSGTVVQKPSVTPVKEPVNPPEKTEPTLDEILPTEGDIVTIEDLSFLDETKILWPVSGDVLIRYSPKHAIYHGTLDQFRTTNAIVISAAQGDRVLACADALVTEIIKDARTGLTVTTAVGNDYSIVYGQLEIGELQVGDFIKQGEVIGIIAAPTRYYCMEGCNLYFKMMHKTETVDPMSYLE